MVSGRWDELELLGVCPAGEGKDSHVTLRGAIIAESLLVGFVLEQIPLTVTRLSRTAIADPAPSQPAVWTLLEFEAEPSHAEALSTHLSTGLASPGWYGSFEYDGDVWVVFPGRVFRYARANASAHEEARLYAHAAGVPEDQCDW
jgi:hypothetical protein